MICSKCIYYAPLVGRSYDLSKCLKLHMFANVARDKCKGSLFFPKITNNKFIKDNKNSVVK